MTMETLATMGHDKLYTGLAGIDVERLKAMRNASLRDCFGRLESTRYRLEFVARILGREYINDAAARTINATWYALDSVQGGIIWIACGVSGEADFSRLVPLALRKVRLLLILGDDERLQHTFAGIIPQIVTCGTLGEALHRAYLYESDDVKVLFSPASDDGTPSAVWGDAFVHEVNEL